MKWKLTKFKWFVNTSFIALMLVLFLSSIPAGERQFKQCILCRTVHIYHKYLTFHWETETENACTMWYRNNVAALHEHAWIACSTPYSTQDIFGNNTSVASNLDYRPAGILHPQQQVDVYEHIGDIEEAQRLFLELRDLVTTKRDEARWIASYLKAWAEDDGFKTPWPQWNRKMRTEIEEYLGPPTE